MHFRFLCCRTPGLVRNHPYVHQHLIEKTAGFARDIERKYGQVS